MFLSLSRGIIFLFVLVCFGKEKFWTEKMCEGLFPPRPPDTQIMRNTGSGDRKIIAVKLSDEEII